MSKRGKQRKYSTEIKQQAVESYLNGEGSLRTICKKYGISVDSVLRRWISWYNGHREFKERSRAKGDQL